VKFLKEAHSAAQGYASEFALKTLASDAACATDTSELIKTSIGVKSKRNISLALRGTTARW
jgi:hypothetical protein